MADLTLPNESGYTIRWLVAVAAVSAFEIVSLQTPAVAEAPMFQQAVNYVFTGKVDPQNGPEIEDKKSCVILLRDPNFNRYVRYYLSRFKMEDALFIKKYSGSRVYYELNVKGDEVVVEYLNLDKKTVVQGYRSAQISLPGDIDQTQKALRIIFTNQCETEKPKTPF
jgi:hypothetical protein